MGRVRLSIVLLAVWSVASACTGATAPRTDQPSGAAAQPARGPKRIVAAMMSNPPSISSEIVGAGSGTIQGGDALEDLVNGGLTVVDAHGVLQPQLAEAVPTVGNGLWKVLPDGRMQTTWKLRAGAAWHDG